MKRRAVTPAVIQAVIPVTQVILPVIPAVTQMTPVIAAVTQMTAVRVRKRRRRGGGGREGREKGFREEIELKNWMSREERKRGERREEKIDRERGGRENTKKR